MRICSFFRIFRVLNLGRVLGKKFHKIFLKSHTNVSRVNNSSFEKAWVCYVRTYGSTDASNFFSFNHHFSLRIFIASLVFKVWLLKCTWTKQHRWLSHFFHFFSCRKIFRKFITCRDIMSKTFKNENFLEPWWKNLELSKRIVRLHRDILKI